MVKFNLVYSPEARESISKLPGNLKNIAERVMLRLAVEPFIGSTKLVGKLKGLYSARITRRYRVIYHIDSIHRIISVIDVIHRKESYR